MGIVNIDTIEYNVLDTEFNMIEHEEFNNLKIVEHLGYYERIISLLTTISKTLKIDESIFYGITHGGFIPIHCIPVFKKIYIIDLDDCQKDNLAKNMDIANITTTDANNIILFENSKTQNVIDINSKNDRILFSENVSFITDTITDIYWSEEGSLPVLITKYSANISNLYHNIFRLSDTDLFIYVPDKYTNYWHNHFHYYLNAESALDEQTGKQILQYDNLINLCIMVKNAGPQFEEMLKANMNLIDEWTILDTGSTDETIDIINRVLVGKKRGSLYQEPFINFRDSRNRLLELAGKSCKYTIMLDDTYVIEGNLREFLETVRGDQFSDSFSFYIKSDDVEYATNRILKTSCELKYLYKIHEVIQFENNTNVIIPISISHILDGRFEYMEERTMTRKQLDLKLLFEELEDDPDNPRTHYYLGQTYNLLKKYEKAYHYFIERMNHPNPGFLQEKIDAVFEAARLANFQLARPWSECEALYKHAYDLDNTRPDAIYFLGIHYYMEEGQANRKRAYEYFKQGFEIGYPLHCQYSLKPTLSFHFLPKFLTQMCYEYNSYELGEKCAKLFLDNNQPDADMYIVIDSWYKIFVFINQYQNSKNDHAIKPVSNTKPILCFVADGGFNQWSGSTILTQGVGGSETYIIEMARHIQAQGYFQIFVFCNCKSAENFEGVQYYHLNSYFGFIKHTRVHTCIISRFTEYYPATILSNVENIYMIAHDLTLSGIVIPVHPKLRKIFCLTEWHVTYFESVFPMLAGYLTPSYYGINPLFENANANANIKEKNSFIYSSFANRGLLQLLQMWPKITESYPDATLNIYTDVEGEWVNRVEPEMMRQVKSIMFSTPPPTNVKYHGWVSKSVLADAWKRAEYWLYPCTFKETFCLTALEAAITKTVAITNDLAALQNTVGDRGLIIPGDATDTEWQEMAIKEVLRIMGDGETTMKTKHDYITRNYEWASKLSWKNQADKLLNDYLLKDAPPSLQQNADELKYVGMQNWTHDLHLRQQSKERFENVIRYFNKKNENTNEKKIQNPQILEIGTYTGTSIIAIISRIPNSDGIAIDKWEDYDEDGIDILKTIKENKIEDVFHDNLKTAGLEHRIFGIKGDSADILFGFIKTGKKFDFIYVDGSHKCLDVSLDLFLSWQILNPGGILAIDDYMYNSYRIKDAPYEYPFEGVNHFLEKKKSEYTLLDKDYRVFIEKI